MNNLVIRAKEIKSGNWVTGDLIHNMKVTTTGLVPRTMVGGYEVEPQSVGLFTGVVDINGKQIFEDDILKVTLSDESTVYKVVRFIPMKAAFCLANNFDLQYDGRWDIWHHLDQRWVKDTNTLVVGNVIDDPDIL